MSLPRPATPTVALRSNVGLRRAPLPARPAVPSIGPWELVRQVYEGSMFRVHQVRPLDRQTPALAGYALKELLPRWEHIPPAIDLLTHEALAGQSINHPHLVAVLSSHLDESPRYVILPWLQGESLATMLRRGRLAVGVAIWVGRQIAEALECMHDAGWLHGDVKPDNILVSPQGHATLIDLGFARRRGERVASFDECLRFTPAYAAPELLSTPEPDARSDLYSLGATLYEALTGQPPFYAAKVDDLLRMHKTERPRDLRLLAADVPGEVSRLVHQLLAKDPLRRPQSARELIAELVDLEIQTFDRR